MLEFAIEQANDGIAIMEFTGDAEVPIRIVYANAAIERLSGYTREELFDPSNPFLQVQPQNRARYEALFVDIRAGNPVRFEVELGGKARATWTEIRWSPLRYSAGVVTHYVAVLRDITERRQADAERELLYHAIEQSLDYIAIYDATPAAQGGPRITYANGAFRHAVGYEADEIVGMSYGRFLAPENDPRLARHVVELVESSQPVEKEMRVLRRDGSTFWTEVSAYPIQAEGMKGHWFAVARDITSRKQTIRDMAVVTRAIDALPIPVEVYSMENGDAVPVFRNRVSEEAAETVREERLAHALASVAIRPAQGDASVVPLCDSAGITDAIVVFSLP